MAGNRSSLYNDFNDESVNEQHMDTLQEIARREREVAESVKQDNSYLKEQIQKQNQRIAQLQQTVDALNFTSNENQALYAEKAQLQDEIQQSASYIANLEEKCLQGNHTSLQLLANLRDCEKEKVEILRESEQEKLNKDAQIQALKQ